MGFVMRCFISCFPLAMDLDLIYKWNSAEFSVDFWELDYFRNFMSNRLGSGFSLFQTGYGIIMPCRFLVWFRDTGTHSRTHGACHVSIYGLRRDNFIGIKAIGFLNPFFYEFNGYRFCICKCLVQYQYYVRLNYHFPFVDNGYTTTTRTWSTS